MLRFFICVILAFIAMPINSLADEKEKLPLPRFVSVRSGEVNVRTGPGAQYPIKWVIVKEKMPVEIIAEFEDWRKIRDIESAEGWVHKAMLSPRRMALIKGQNKKIYEDKDTKSKVVAMGNNGAIVKVNKCDGDYCEVENDKMSGFIKPEDLWGVYEGEKFKK